MSVQSFLDSAKILYDNQKYNEALCLVCIAIDSCAAQEYPNEKNANRYKKFLKKILGLYVNMDFREFLLIISA